MPKKTSQCYLCGRDEKEFFELLNPNTYDKKISAAELSLRDHLEEMSKDIKSILKKTKDYDGSFSIETMIHKGIFTEFMPDWKLLLKYKAPKTRTNYHVKISTIREMLLKALEQLDNGECPKGIFLPKEIQQAEKELEKLKKKKETLSKIIANPEFKTYETKLGSPGTSRSPDGKISVKYKLCPICSTLLTTHHNPIAAQTDD